MFKSVLRWFSFLWSVLGLSGRSDTSYLSTYQVDPCPEGKHDYTDGYFYTNYSGCKIYICQRCGAKRQVSDPHI